MFSDERIQKLLRDAHDLDSFERGGAPVPSVVTGKSFTRWVFAAAAAIAVMTAVGVVVVQSVARSRRPEPQLVAHAGHGGTRTAPTSSLLLAVYQDGSGELSCVNWSSEALNGRTVSSFSSEELTRMGLAMGCDPEAARLLVVGLEGPAASLPSSDDRANLVAQCLSTTTPCASGTFNPGTCASAGCIDTAVKVRVESLTLR